MKLRGRKPYLLSLRARATSWYVGLLAVALLIFSMAVYAGIRSYLRVGLERVLASTVETVETEFLSKLDTKGDKWVLGELRESYESTANERYLRLSENGAILYQTAAMSDPAIAVTSVPLPPASARPAFHTVTVSGRSVMTCAALYRAPDGRTFEIESGTSLLAMQQTLLLLRKILVTASILILLLALVGGYLLMKLPLRPLVVLTENAESIGRKELGKRLPVIRSGDELERLAHSLNGMIDRLEEGLAHNYRFSADASHELRTPLMILRGEMEEMIRIENLPEEAVGNLISSLEEIDRMSQIVNSLMTITRLDAGGERMAAEFLDLCALARTTIEHMRLLADEKQLSLTMDCAGPVFVNADPMRIKQVLVNLIDNSIKYSAPEDSGCIQIAITSSGSHALLEVRDQGVGIPVEALPHVFDRFYRADFARSRVAGGVGLGLAIVKAIVTAHDGTVSIGSTPEPVRS